jgi:type I restriction enzyme M protein
MNTPSSTIVQRLWNYCNVLRDDGMSYGDYVEQLTYLLFLKMDAENASMLGRLSAIPSQYNWGSLQRLNGDDLESHYRAILTGLGQGTGLRSAGVNLRARKCVILLVENV